MLPLIVYAGMGLLAVGASLWYYWTAPTVAPASTITDNPSSPIYTSGDSLVVPPPSGAGLDSEVPPKAAADGLSIIAVLMNWIGENFWFLLAILALILIVVVIITPKFEKVTYKGSVSMQAPFTFYRRK